MVRTGGSHGLTVTLLVLTFTSSSVYDMINLSNANDDV